MKKKKSIYFTYLLTALFLIFVLSLNFSGCSQRERIIKIGCQNVFSGEFKSFGEEQLVSMSVAAGELAPVRIGGFDYKISIITKDDEGSAEKAYLSAQELLQENVSAVIGSSFNATTKAALPVYQEYNIPMLTPSAPGIDLSKSDINFFRMIINNSQVIENTAVFIKDNFKVSRMAIINTESEYDLNFTDYLENIIREFPDLKIETLKRYTINAQSADLKLLAENLLIDDMELVFFCGDYSLLAKIITEAKAAGVKSVFLTEKFSMNDGLLQLASADILEGLMAVVPEPPSLAAFSEDPKALEFYRKFKSKAAEIEGLEIEEPGDFAPYSYDAFYIIIDAMIRSNSNMPEDFLEEIRNTSYEGVTGRIEFDSNGNIKEPKSTVFIVKNGSWVRYQK